MEKIVRTNITPTVGSQTRAILAAKRGGLRYVVWEPAWSCYVITPVVLGRKIIWENPEAS